MREVPDHVPEEVLASCCSQLGRQSYELAIPVATQRASHPVAAGMLVGLGIAVSTPIVLLTIGLRDQAQNIATGSGLRVWLQDIGSARCDMIRDMVSYLSYFSVARLVLRCYGSS